MKHKSHSHGVSGHSSFSPRPFSVGRLFSVKRLMLSSASFSQEIIIMTVLAPLPSINDCYLGKGDNLTVCVEGFNVFP